MKKIYIAETDDTGRIACVWIAAEKQRSARLFDPSKHRFDLSNETEITGASRPDVIAWFEANKPTNSSLR